MKPEMNRRFTFIGKSLLWSLLLYVVMMSVMNWEEIRNTVKGGNSITVVTTEQNSDGNTIVSHANISERKGFVNDVAALLKTLSGFAVSSVSN
jgi:hypothetical protein